MSEYIQGYIDRARAAQAEAERWSQAEADRAVNAVAKAIYDNAEDLARLAVDETGMGVVEDKFAKNRNKARMIAADLSTKKSVGVIGRDEAVGVTEIAKPVGVVAAITPVTNPIVTPMGNAMFSLKGRNAIVITPHHRAVRASTRAVELMKAGLKGVGAPEHIIQIIGEQSRDNTQELIASADVVIATGGMGMVKAAYRSGKPALGVGAGNVQCIIGRDADLTEAVPMIVDGRAFDNGIICAAEQSIIFPAEMEGELIDALAANRAACLPRDPEAVSSLRDALFTEDGMNRHLVGQSAQAVAAAAGLAETANANGPAAANSMAGIPADTRVIAVFADGAGAADRLSGEKMCPVISLYPYETFDEAVAIAKANLEYEGKGHSVSLHTGDEAHIEYAGTHLPVSRILVNQCCATNAGGSFYNGLAPTNTLGCGSWGNNSISENLTYKHLINISRVATRLPDDRFAWFEL
ncbi:MAG: aldehyde dehydrogenase family protein [Clostridiales Family XIII bacterium]|jgi:succinate-semialdehyde dehydrogenase|nr:aldehyde dehydrogenase family protein [Clostridiales Family XIII bacterium]